MSSPRRLSLGGVLLAGAAASSAGCLPGLTVVPLQSSAAKPSNVAVYFSVETNDHKPVGGLTAADFTIFEDGARVGPLRSRQVVLSSKLVASRDTLVLIDMSGRVVGAKEVGEVIKSATAFVERVEKPENVAMYTWDGGAELTSVVPFANLEMPAAEKIAAEGRKPVFDDAVRAGLGVLEKALTADPKLIKLGTLVVITDSAGHGNRTISEELQAALSTPESSRLDIFAVGIGPDVDTGRLSEVGRSGTVIEPDAANMAKAFDAVGTKVGAAAARYYLFSYCTPARGGAHEVRIEAHARDGLLGDMTSRFSAEGFVAGCDPTNPPPFEPVRVVETVPPVDKKKEPTPPPKKPARKPAYAPAQPPTSPPPARPAPPPAADPFAP